MSIDSSPHIDLYIKAKLQENGVLTTRQLRSILASVQTPVSSTESASAVLNNQCSGLREKIPSLTQEEARALLETDWTESRLEVDSEQSSPEEKPQQRPFPFKIRTLGQLKEEEKKLRKRGDRCAATTFCRSLDELLNGGAKMGQVTEISGPPGAGKTQFLMQLAVSCTLPIVMGGLGGACIYIDTEGSFVPERFYQIVFAAASLVAGISKSEKHLENDRSSSGSRKRSRSSASPHSKLDSTDLSAYTAEFAMKRVHYCRVSDATMLMAVLHSLPEAMKEYSRLPDNQKTEKTEKIKMVIIDSVAMPFRSLSPFDESECLEGPRAYKTPEVLRKEAAGKRARIIFMMSQLLHSYAVNYNLAIVVSNHVASQYNSQRQQNNIGSSAHERTKNTSTVLIPALGDSWGFGLSCRLLLSYHHHDPQFSTSDNEISVKPSNPEKNRKEAGDELSEPSATSQFQHRVARLIKGSPEYCKEVCFAISRKGIRNWPHQKN